MQKYQNNVQTLDGRAIVGASVTVTEYPGGAPATVYNSNGSGVITQPILTNGDGEFAFYAANGRYQLQITGGGISVAQNIQDIILFDPADGTSASDVTFTQGGTGAVSRSAQGKLRDVVSVFDFMTTAQISDVQARTRTLDMSAPIQAALTYAASVGAEVVLPRGDYKKSDLGAMWQAAGNVRIRGEGSGTVIYFEDLPANPRNDMLNIASGSRISFSDLTITGTLLSNLTQTNQSQCIVGDAVTSLVFNRVRFENLRFMAVAVTNVDRFSAEQCQMENILRDGFHLPDCHGATITDNDFKNVSDDVIGIHSSDGGTGVLPNGHIITGNRFETCQGVKILGAKVANVSGNTFRRPIRGCVYISNNDTNDTTEGNTPIFAIKVSNNIVIDPFSAFNRDWAFRVNLRPLAKGALSSQPGFVTVPYPYNYGRNIDAAGGINPGAFCVEVSGNIVSRTLESGKTMSDFGYSSILDRAALAFVNYAVVDTSFDVDGIYFSGAVQNFSISGNKISGLGAGRNAIRIDDAGGAQNVRGGSIDSNAVHDCPGIGILFGSSSGSVCYVDIINNKFDLDPFFRSSAHNADNTWTNSSSVIGVALNVKVGGQMYGNTFNNLGNPVSGDATLVYLGQNYVFGSLAVAGDDASNKGVRFINVLLNHVFVQCDSDPLSATYGLVQTVPMSMSSAMPSSGHYVRGHVVKKHTPTVAGAGGSQYTVTGWWRATTGNAHVANTDWYEMRQLTGT